MMSDLPIWLPITIGIITGLAFNLTNQNWVVNLYYRVLNLLMVLTVLLNIVNLCFIFFLKYINAPLAISILQSAPNKTEIVFIDGALIGTGIIWLLPSYSTMRIDSYLDQPQFYKLLCVVMGTYFLFTGTGKIPGHEVILAFFIKSGYNSSFLNLIIFVEITCALGLFFRKTAFFAALILFVEMLGATFTHYHNFFAYQTPEPFLNSFDSLKMLPFLLSIAIYNSQTNKSQELTHD